MPTSNTLAPKVVVRKSGNSAWMVSEEISMKKLTKPSAHTVRGIGVRGRCVEEASDMLTHLQARRRPIHIAS